MGEAEVAPCAKVGNAALSDIYCSVGWRHWGAKSWQCKSASNLFGIPPHVGNPFYCGKVDRYFENGVTSLEKHLLESHSDSFSLIGAIAILCVPYHSHRDPSEFQTIDPSYSDFEFNFRTLTSGYGEKWQRGECRTQLRLAKGWYRRQQKIKAQRLALPLRPRRQRGKVPP